MWINLEHHGRLSCGCAIPNLSPCFAHDDGHGGFRGKGNDWTEIITFDDAWRRTGGYVLPGSMLRHVATLDAPIHGQAFSFDHASGGRIVYGLDRPGRAVVIFELPLP